MKPAPFEYFSPKSLEEAVGLMERYGEEAKLLAGGQSLVPIMNLRLAAPAVVVDLNRIQDLASIREEGDQVVVGAMTRHHDVATSEIIRSACPMLSFAASLIGYPAIRYRGTLGGSLAHADPVAEMPCVALTLDAELVLAGPAARRTVPASEFFLGYLSTALQPDEVLVEARYPRISPGNGWGFREFTRKAGDFALAAVAVDLGVEDGAVRGARLGMAGAADRPVRAEEAERILIGSTAGDSEVREAASALAAAAGPVGDAHAGERYRRHLLKVVAERAIRGALEVARGTRRGGHD